MKLQKALLMGALIGGSAAGFSQIVKATTTAGTATAAIRAAISLIESTQLDFGVIDADVAGDTITILPAGTVSATGLSVSSGSPAPGAWAATGDASASVTISFSAGDTLTGPGTAMALDNFAHDAGGTPAFDGGGALAFAVGADLTVGAAQLAGTYNGSYDVTVNYQ